jgi:hypothetical protein
VHARHSLAPLDGRYGKKQRLSLWDAMKGKSGCLWYRRASHLRQTYQSGHLYSCEYVLDDRMRPKHSCVPNIGQHAVRMHAWELQLVVHSVATFPRPFATTKMGPNSGSRSIPTLASPDLLDSVNLHIFANWKAFLASFVVVSINLSREFMYCGCLPHLEAQKGSFCGVATAVPNFRQST